LHIKKNETKNGKSALCDAFVTQKAEKVSGKGKVLPHGKKEKAETGMGKNPMPALGAAEPWRLPLKFLSIHSPADA
jgi:hypothetical protein